MLVLPSKDSPEFLCQVGTASEADLALKPGNRCGQGVTGRALAISKEFGLKSHQTVVVEASNTRAVIETIFACFKLGLSVVLLPSGLKEAEKRRYLEAVPHKKIFNQDLELTFEKTDVEMPLNLSSKVFFFTSGSAGKPKLVVHRLENLFDVAAASNKVTKLESSGIWLLSLPISHVGGFSILLRAILSRARVGLAQGLGLKNLSDNIARFKATHVSLVPTMLEVLVESFSENQHSSLEAVLVSGAPIDRKLQHRAVSMGIPIICSYGLTEAGSTVSSTEVISDAQQLGHAGKCLSGVELRISDTSGKKVSPATVGEIQLRGQNLFEGYFGESASGKYINDWFSTGDLGLIDEFGNLELVGRSSRLIISGGENIDPREIEQLVQEHSLVSKAAVVAELSEKWGERPILFVELKKDHDLVQAKATLSAFLENQLSSRKRPDRIEIVDRMPMLGVGKIDYKGLL